VTGRPPFLDAGPRAVLLGRVRALTIDDLRALDAAVRSLVAEKAHRHVDKGVLFAWWDGPASGRRDELRTSSRQCWPRSPAGCLVSTWSVGGALPPTPPVSSRQLPSASRESGASGASIGLIEDAVAPWDPRLAVVATWNMACATALRDHLPATMVATLEAAWRRALGEPPV
jgi:hypothetical protein